MKQTKFTNRISSIFGVLFAAIIGMASGSYALGFLGLILALITKSGMSHVGSAAFMAVFDPTDASLEDEDIQSLDEAIYEGLFRNPKYMDFHDIVEGIKANKKIIVLGNLTGLAGAVQANCVPGANETVGAITKKVWTPEIIEDRWTECYKDLLGTFWQKFLKPGVDKADLSSTDYATYLGKLLAPYIQEINLRIAYFGDTAVAAGTGNNITAGQLKYFSPINGFWKQIAAIVAGNPAQNVDITKNGGATFVLQAFDAADVTNQVVTAAFTSAYMALDTRVRELPKSDLVYICTQSMTDQYWQERMKASGIELAYTRTETGWDKLQFNGIDVIPFPFLDRIIRTYYGDDATPTSWVNPHRAILCTKKTLKIGTESQGTLDQFLPFYSMDDKNYKVDWGTTLDAKIALDHEIVAIY